MIIYLSAEDIIQIHDEIILRFGGLPGLREESLLLSAADSPAGIAFGTEFYPGIPMKAACYMHKIIKNHPFLDGNKRTACSTALVFLDINGFQNQIPETEFEEIAIGIASDSVICIGEVASFLAKYCT